jgi:hypothetical protein
MPGGATAANFFAPSPARAAALISRAMPLSFSILTVRFLCRESGVRDLKDAMTRELLAALEGAGIEIASATFAIIGLPPLRLEQAK